MRARSHRHATGLDTTLQEGSVDTTRPQHTAPRPDDTIGQLKHRWGERLIDWAEHAVDCEPCRPMDRRSGCLLGLALSDRELALARLYNAAMDDARQRGLRVLP